MERKKEIDTFTLACDIVVYLPPYVFMHTYIHMKLSTHVYIFQKNIIHTNTKSIRHCFVAINTKHFIRDRSKTNSMF